MLDFEKIKKECPKSWELLRKWTEGKIQEMKTKIMSGAPPNTEELPFPEINDVIVESTISWQLRSLTDFFDLQKVYISVQETQGQFQYDVGTGGGWSDSCKTRIEAELIAYRRAFEVLEGKQ